MCAKRVLASLWDEGLIRPVSAIANELGVPENEVEEELGNLKKNGLARIRKTNENGSPLWKITWKGQEYLSQISWLGDLMSYASCMPHKNAIKQLASSLGTGSNQDYWVRPLANS